MLICKQCNWGYLFYSTQYPLRRDWFYQMIWSNQSRLSCNALSKLNRSLWQCHNDLFILDSTLQQELTRFKKNGCRWPEGLYRKLAQSLYHIGRLGMTKILMCKIYETEQKQSIQSTPAVNRRMFFGLHRIVVECRPPPCLQTLLIYLLFSLPLVHARRDRVL